MVDEFLAGLIKTNRSHEFFVDWTKARSYQTKYQDELALLASVSTSGADAEQELKRLLLKYPRINELIPLLLAIRMKSSELDVVDEVAMKDLVYTFAGSAVDEEAAEKTIYFCKKTGLLEELASIKNHSDYYFGVEVGSDTNARKNRSGTAMENLIEPYIQALIEEHDGKFFKQKSFSFAAKEFGVKIPPDEADKRGDFMILVNGLPINIEVNYFDGGGSKQEIMNSYIPRAENLKKAGWVFALVTDGAGWLKNKKQVELGYREIKNIFNAKMCKEGDLQKLL
jgi:type II restriction enzyme